MDVGSRVGQVLLWREEGASIAASSLCVCAWAVAAKEGTSLYVIDPSRQRQAGSRGSINPGGQVGVILS